MIQYSANMKQNTIIMLILMAVLIFVGLVVTEMRRNEQSNEIKRMIQTPTPAFKPSS